MDRRLYDASISGNITILHRLVQEDEEILDQVAPNSSNTALHLAARFGHRGFAEELIKLRPAMASAENRNLETPVHEASREGNLEVLILLVDMEPSAVWKVNAQNESALTLACGRGHVSVVKALLSRSQLLAAEIDNPSTSLHAAASGGYTGDQALSLHLCISLPFPVIVRFLTSELPSGKLLSTATIYWNFSNWQQTLAVFLQIGG